MENTYTEKQLVEFGNFLLSDKRNKSISRVNKQNVTDADISNFKELD